MLFRIKNNLLLLYFAHLELVSPFTTANCFPQLTGTTHATADVLTGTSFVTADVDFYSLVSFMITANMGSLLLLSCKIICVYSSIFHCEFSIT